MVSSCGWLTCAPISVRSSSGSPTTISRARLTSFSTNASCALPCTRTLLPALQTSPLFPKMPQKHASTALVMSASAKTTWGLLPPSSRVSFFRLVSAEAWSSRRAVRTEPVKAILSTPGCRASASPVGAPYPGSTLSTPGGKPTSRASSPSFIPVSGVSSLGLRMTVQPVASAGPSFQQARQVA
jgi:hypothetical protein